MNTGECGSAAKSCLVIVRHREHSLQRRVGDVDGREERRHPDSNRGVEVLQTSALPLGYAAFYEILKN